MRIYIHGDLLSGSLGTVTHTAQQDNFMSTG